jgi:hypothetical protein
VADLSLQLNKGQPNYRDLLVLNNDLVFTSDQNPSGTNNVLQDILQNLNFFLGEWFLDNTIGVPWFQQILVKAPDTGAIDALIQNAILGTPGVKLLTSYSRETVPLTRGLIITFAAVTTSGTVSYTGTVGSP